MRYPFAVWPSEIGRGPYAQHFWSKGKRDLHGSCGFDFEIGSYSGHWNAGPSRRKHVLADSERGVRVSDHCLGWRNLNLSRQSIYVNRHGVIRQPCADSKIAQDLYRPEPCLKCPVLPAE